MSLANKSPNKKEQLMPKNPYILFEYTLNGNLVVSAIHYYDISKFRLEHPDAKIKVA